jgi:hypothetical protein
VTIFRWLIPAALVLSGCHGDPSPAQAPLQGTMLRTAPEPAAPGSALASGRALTVRTLPFYRSKDFRQVLGDAGTPEGYVAAAELWPYPLPSTEIYAGKETVALSDGSAAALGSVLHVAAAGLLPGRRVVVRDGLAVASVAASDVREASLTPDEWRAVLIAAVKSRRWEDASRAAKDAQVPALAQLAQEHAAGLAEKEQAIYSVTMPALEWTAAKPELVFVRGLSVKLLDKPGGALVKALPFGTSLTMLGAEKGWAEVAFSLPAELESDEGFSAIRRVGAPSNGVGWVKLNELTAGYPSANALRSSVKKLTEKGEARRALNPLAYLHLLGRNSWDALVDASFATGDFTFLRGLVRANLEAVRPAPGNVATASRAAVHFVSGCKDFIRRGRTTELTGVPEWISLGEGTQVANEEPVDCYDLDFAKPCAVVNGASLAQDQLSAQQQRTFDAEFSKGERAREKLVKQIEAKEKGYSDLVGAPGVRISFALPKDCKDGQYFVYRSTHVAQETGPFRREDKVTDAAPIALPAEALECESAVVLWVPGETTGALEYGVLRAASLEEATAWLAERKFTILESLWGPQIVPGDGLQGQVSALNHESAAPAEEGARLVSWGLSRNAAGECTGADANAASFLDWP